MKKKKIKSKEIIINNYLCNNRRRQNKHCHKNNFVFSNHFLLLLDLDLIPAETNWEISRKFVKWQHVLFLRIERGFWKLPRIILIWLVSFYEWQYISKAIKYIFHAKLIKTNWIKIKLVKVLNVMYYFITRIQKPLWFDTAWFDKLFWTSDKISHQNWSKPVCISNWVNFPAKKSNLGVWLLVLNHSNLVNIQ